MWMISTLKPHCPLSRSVLFNGLVTELQTGEASVGVFFGSLINVAPSDCPRSSVGWLSTG
jgi:hypothetical protein